MSRAISQKILVTGGAGFIGRHVCRALRARKHDIVILDNFSNAEKSGLDGLGTVIEGDIRDTAILDKALDGVGHVIHLAALVSVPVSLQKPEETFEINVAGTERLLHACVKVKLPGRFLYASSAAVYSNALEGHFKEIWADGRDLLSPYASSKYINEIQATAYGSCYALKTTGLRFFNVYGPGQDPKSPYSGVMSKILEAQSENKTFTIFGDGNITRDYIFVTDIAKAIADIAPMTGALPPVLNLGTGKVTSLNELAETWKGSVWHALDVTHGAPRPGDQKHSCADITLLKQVIPDWNPLCLQDGLRRWLK